MKQGFSIRRPQDCVLNASSESQKKEIIIAQYDETLSRESFRFQWILCKKTQC